MQSIINILNFIDYAIFSNPYLQRVTFVLKKVFIREDGW